MNSTNIFKPILFSTEMVQAILAGRKTQTRRIVKPQPKEGIITSDDWNENFWTSKIKIEDNPDRFEITQTFKPKYQTADILWVRETFQESECFDFEMKNQFVYKANKADFNFAKEFNVKWKPSLFMPKEVARIFLKVTNVRCERLQDINFWDAIKEGIEVRLSDGSEEFRDYLAKNQNTEFFGSWGETYFSAPNNSFESLWDSINAKKYPWKSNPWVWVYDFERIEKPENFI